MNRKIISLSLFIIVLAGACAKSNSGDTTFTLDCSTVAKFSTEVAPIISSTCATKTGCHASGSIEGPGPLTNYTQIFTSRASIRDAIVRGIMPKEGTLSNAQKNAIVCWIDSGAPND